MSPEEDLHRGRRARRGPADGRRVIRERTDAEGELRALPSFVPWGAEGRTPEPVRRADEAGITRLSLNFAIFRSVFERGSRLGAGPALRLRRSLLGLFSRWWHIESLARAHATYRPVGGLDAVRAGGFLEAPGLPERLNRKQLEKGR